MIDRALALHELNKYSPLILYSSVAENQRSIKLACEKSSAALIAHTIYSIASPIRFYYRIAHTLPSIALHVYLHHIPSAKRKLHTLSCHAVDVPEVRIS